MKKFLEMIMLILLFLSIGENGNSFEINDEVISFAIGLGGGFGGHEFGHQIVSDCQGTSISFTGKGCEFSGGTDAQFHDAGLGGFGSEIFGSEMVFQSNFQTKSKNNNIVLGYMCWNIINPISYTFQYELSGKKSQGDLAVVKENGGNVRFVEAMIISHALWSAWRLYEKMQGKKDTRVEFLSSGENVSAYPFFKISPPNEKNNRQLEFEFGINWRL